MLVQMTGESAGGIVCRSPLAPLSMRRARLGSLPRAMSGRITFQSAPSRARKKRWPEPAPPFGAAAPAGEPGAVPRGAAAGEGSPAGAGAESGDRAGAEADPPRGAALAVLPGPASVPLRQAPESVAAIASSRAGNSTEAWVVNGDGAGAAERARAALGDAARAGVGRLFTADMIAQPPWLRPARALTPAWRRRAHTAETASSVLSETRVWSEEAGAPKQKPGHPSVAGRLPGRAPSAAGRMPGAAWRSRGTTPRR